MKNHKLEFAPETSPEEMKWASDTLIDQTDTHNQPIIRAIYHRYWDQISAAPGSSHNHQAWPGGYLEHIRQVNQFTAHLYSLWSKLGIFASLPDEERFSLGEALTVTSLHDIEKPFKVITSPDGQQMRKPALLTKQQRDQFKWDFFEEHGIVLNANQRNAMKHVEGFANDYSPNRRVICPMGVIAHAADLMSARASFNLGNPSTEYPLL